MPYRLRLIWFDEVREENIGNYDLYSLLKKNVMEWFSIPFEYTNYVDLYVKNQSLNQVSQNQSKSQWIVTVKDCFTALDIPPDSIVDVHVKTEPKQILDKGASIRKEYQEAIHWSSRQRSHPEEFFRQYPHLDRQQIWIVDFEEPYGPMSWLPANADTFANLTARKRKSMEISNLLFSPLYSPLQQPVQQQQSPVPLSSPPPSSPPPPPPPTPLKKPKNTTTTPSPLQTKKGRRKKNTVIEEEEKEPQPSTTSYSYSYAASPLRTEVRREKVVVEDVNEEEEEKEEKKAEEQQQQRPRTPSPPPPQPQPRMNNPFDYFSGGRRRLDEIRRQNYEQAQAAQAERLRMLREEQDRAQKLADARREQYELDEEKRRRAMFGSVRDYDSYYDTHNPFPDVPYTRTTNKTHHHHHTYHNNYNHNTPPLRTPLQQQTTRQQQQKKASTLDLIQHAFQEWYDRSVLSDPEKKYMIRYGFGNLFHPDKCPDNFTVDTVNKLKLKEADRWQKNIRKDISLQSLFNSLISILKNHPLLTKEQCNELFQFITGLE